MKRNYKSKLKKIALGTSIFAISMCLCTGNSKAVLQANGNTAATYGIDDWMSNVRKMETLGGAMGLIETINSNLTSSSTANNIDVHMQKNTEYGALAILSASSYGNPNVITDGQTTTGNSTGVVMKLNSEWVAAGTMSSSTIYKNAVARYKNVYTNSYVVKTGDAIAETAGWHSSGSSIWIKDNNIAGLFRAYSGSIFSYYGTYTRDNGGYNHGAACYNGASASRKSGRAVVVQGQGI